MDYSSQSPTLLVGSLLYIVFLLAIIILMITSLWKIFTKAGRPGWKSIIPFYNFYILLKISGRPGWWMLFFLVPFGGIIVSFILSVDLAKSFGKSTVFGIVLLGLLPLIGYPMLGFGKSTYIGSNAGSSMPGQTPEPVISVPVTPILTSTTQSQVTS